MSVKVASNRFIVSSKVSEYAALYQQVITQVSDFQRLGQRLVAHAEIAQDFRQTERLECLGTILSHLPIQEYRHIGQYYLAWCAYRKGENTQAVFEQVIEKSSTYKAKGLISLAAVVSANGDYELGAKYYAEAVKIDASPSIIVPAARSIAVIKSMDGSHRSALADLERIAPLARYATPKTYYDYLNSFSVELCENGHTEEATNICRVVLASPYTFAYPEWRETEQELALQGYKSRSSVSLTQRIPGNLLYLPERSLAPDTPVQPGRARILSYQNWKKKMGKENGEQNLDEMSDKDLFMEIMHQTSQGTITRKKLLKFLAAIQKIKSEPDED